MDEDLKTTLRNRVDEAKARLLDVRSRLDSSRGAVDEARSMSNRFISDGAAFEDAMRRGLLKDAKNYEPFEKAKNDALADQRYVYDLQRDDLNGMSFGGRNSVLSQRGRDNLSRFYTNDNVVNNIKGQVSDILGRALSAYNTKAQLAAQQAQYADQDYRDLLGLERYERGYTEQAENALLQALMAGSGGGGGRGRGGSGSRVYGTGDGTDPYGTDLYGQDGMFEIETGGNQGGVSGVVNKAVNNQSILNPFEQFRIAQGVLQNDPEMTAKARQEANLLGRAVANRGQAASESGGGLIGKATNKLMKGVNKIFK